MWNFSQVSPWINNNFQVNHVLDWMENLSCNEEVELSDLSKAILTCWQIWQDRNTKVFNSIDPNAFKSAVIASKVGNAYFMANNFTSRRRTPEHNDIIRWVSPPPGFVKLNFDGSVSAGRGAADAGQEKGCPKIMGGRGLITHHSTCAWSLEAPLAYPPDHQ